MNDESYGPVQPVADTEYGPLQAEVSPGAAPPVDENPAARRRVLMAVPSPADESGDNLGVVPLPSVNGSAPDPQRLADNYLAAYRASKAGITPERAAQALKVSRQTGFSPQFAADRLDAAQQQADQQQTADKLARAPNLAEYANQSAVHAAAVKDDLDHLSMLEWAITGKWEHSVVGKDQPGFYTPPFWWAALKDAIAEQKYIAITGKKGTLGVTPEEQTQLEQLRAQQQDEGSNYGAQGLPGKLIAKSVRALPSLWVLGSGVATGAPAGPPGMFVGGTVAGFAESYGPLYDRLSLLTDEEGNPVLSEKEARAIAAVGAAATSAVAQWVGGPLLQKLPGIREILGKITGQGLVQAVARPQVAKLLTDAGVKFGQNYMAGVLMMMAQNGGTAATEEVAKATHNQPADFTKPLAAAADGGLQALVDLPLIAAYEPIVSVVGGVVRGAAEQRHLDTMVKTAKSSPLVGREPGVAAEVLQQSADTPGASDTAYIPKEAWDAFHGTDAQKRAAELAQDNGRAYAEADASGGPVAIPIEQHLTAGLADAEKLLPDTKLSPDSYTPNEAKEVSKNLAGQGEALPSNPPEPSRAEAASYRDAALEFLNKKPIGEIRPEYYASAGRRMGQRAVELSAEQDQTGLGDVQRRQAFNVVAEKAAREIREEMDKLQTRIGKVDRGALAAGDPAYAGAYDALRGALEGRSTPGGLDSALSLMEANARQYGFDEKAVADLLANPRPWAKLTPIEARNLADAVASIRKAATDARAVELSDRRAGLREFVAEAADYAAKHGPPGPPGEPPGTLPLPSPSNAGKSGFEKAVTKVDALATEGLRAEVILRRLGPPGDRIMDAFTKARNYHAELQGTVGNEIAKAIDKVPSALRKIRYDGVDGVGSPVVNDNKWVRQDLWMLAGMFGSESGAQRLRNGYRISDDQILRALSQLTKPEAEFVDSLHALHDEKLWPLVRDHEVATTGTSPPKIEARQYTIMLSDGTTHTFRGGYWPGINADPVPMVAPTAGESAAQAWGTLRDGIPATAKPFVNERSEQTAYRPDLNWDAHSRNINAVLRYLGYDSFVSNTSKVFYDRQFRRVLTAQQGEKAPAQLDKFLSVAARGYVEPAKDGATTLNTLVGGGFRSRIASAAFALNPRVMMAQLSHIPAALVGVRIAPWHMLEGLSKGFIPSTWSEAHEQSSQLSYRWHGFGSKMREQLASISPDEPLTQRKWIDAASWSLYHVMDGFLSKTIWESAKTKAAAQGLDEAAQVVEADKAVSVMMPPLNLAEQSAVARDRGMIGSLLLVRNFPNTLYNVGAMQAWQAKTGVWESSPGLSRAAAIIGGTTLAAASYLGVTWSAHIFGQFFLGHGRDPDESWGDWLTRNALSAPFYPLPFGTDVAEPLAAAAVAKLSKGKPIAQTLLQHNTSIQSAPALALLETAIRDFGLAMHEGKADSQRMAAAAKLAALALRLPTYPVTPAQYTYQLFNGEARPRGPFDVAGGLLYGQRPRQAKNPFTAAQDVLSGR